MLPSIELIVSVMAFSTVGEDSDTKALIMDVGVSCAKKRKAKRKKVPNELGGLVVDVASRLRPFCALHRDYESMRVCDYASMRVCENARLEDDQKARSLRSLTSVIREYREEAPAGTPDLIEDTRSRRDERADCHFREEWISSSERDSPLECRGRATDRVKVFGEK